LGLGSAGSVFNKSNPVFLGQDPNLALSPTQVGSSSWTAIAAGYSYAAAIRSDSILFTWGSNNAGQLGDGTTVNKSSPAQLTSNSWSQITAGTSFILAIRSTDYSLWSCGLNGAGQLGINDTFNRSSPVQIGTSSWTQVSAGQSHVSGTKLDKTIWSWGYNFYGQLAVTDIINRSSPTQISTTSWLGSISSSGNNFIQYDVFGTLITGRNETAQLGLVASDTIHRSSPVLVPSVSYPTAAYAIVSPTRLVAFSWLQLSAGNTYSMGILTDNTLWGWGVNSLGQLGINNTIIRSSPVQVGTSNWSQVNAGPYQHTIGIKLDNTLWSWGLNSSGQLGLNNTINRSSPVQIGTNLWVSAIPGFSHTVGLNSFNIAYAWGLNSLGQLGLNNTSNKSSPVQLATTFIDSQVAAGGNNSSVLDRYGVLYNWGDNSYGQLGDG
jgi:alpha-tubulin suppressor-like RCC1 family protein